MSLKIIFLEDGTVTARRLKRALIAAGHHCAEASSEDRLRAILQDGASIIIHVPSEPRRFAAVLPRIAVDWPRMPVLHIIEDGNFQPGEWLKGPLHDWVGITASVDTVLRKVETLAHFAALETEVAEHRGNETKLNNFMKNIRGVETGAVVRAAMETLGEEFAASNVLWFPETVLDLEIEQYSRNRVVVPITGRQPGRVNWASLKECSPSQLQQIFEQWQLLTSVTDGMDETIIEIGGAPGGLKDLIVPIKALETQIHPQPYGHLVFVEPGNWPALRGTRLVSRYWDLLSQQLSDTRAYGRLQSMTYKDDLTDLYNQRYLPVILDQELSRASRLEKEFSVLFLDVDFFKMVNDTKGHMVGSKVLVELSKLFRTSIRGTDFAFRYGGDEYVIVLSGASSKNATYVAERLRQKTQETTFNINGNDVKITVSIGIATYPQHAKSTEELLHMADEAMYYGKNKSRNVVYVAS